MRNITVAAIQMCCVPDPAENLRTAERLVRQAAGQGAQVVLLPELFEREYFCQQRRYDFYAYATPTAENPAVQMGIRLAQELHVVLPISFFERDCNNFYNTVACIDAPGDTGFRVFRTKFGCIGVGICWDQWFPETARSMALLGAELLLYPTAIGSEPILECDSMPHWQRCMQGHAAANLMPVIAANRIGTEAVLPCPENGGQRSELCFYGSSFLTDETGALLQCAPRDAEAVLLQTYDLDALLESRSSWGLFRDRRPEYYGAITHRAQDSLTR